jgi:hypothetical protein
MKTTSVRPVDELDRLLDEARLAEAARSRQQERWLRQVDEEDASLVGTLVDLAERGPTVAIETIAGTHRGRIRLVAHDFCILGTARDEVWIPYPALAVVRPDVSSRPVAASGNRVAADLHLVDGLAALVAERPAVTLVAEGARRVSGVLVGVGRDVVSVRLEGEETSIAYVPVASLRAESNVNQIG